MSYIVDAWNEALADGVSQMQLTHSTFFISLTDLVSTYGEAAVADFVETLSGRILAGEFTVYRSRQ
jgi:hypothetical protein